jgi:hypothetical protein
MVNKTETPKDQKCECMQTAYVSLDRLDLYDEVTERPFVNHKPGECKCTNELKQYEINGKKVYLCSCCC